MLKAYAVSMPDTLTLEASRIRFYHESDERAFFEWLSRIPAVDHYEGAGDTLYIKLRRSPDRADLQELLALFFRYGADLRQFQPLVASEDRKWFSDTKSFWHASVFST